MTDDGLTVVFGDGFRIETDVLAISFGPPDERGFVPLYVTPRGQADGEPEGFLYPVQVYSIHCDFERWAPTREEADRRMRVANIREQLGQHREAVAIHEAQLVELGETL